MDEKTENKFVSFHYILKDSDDGSIIDSSYSRGPLEFISGQNYILPKLEEAILLKTEGEKFNVDLKAEDAYGVYDESLTAVVPRENFEMDGSIEVGMKFQAMGEMGMQIVRVIKVQDDEITIDVNHELAGKNLSFEVELLELRDVTEDDIAEMTKSCGDCGGGCGGCGGDCSEGCGEGDCGDCCGGCCSE